MPAWPVVAGGCRLVGRCVVSGMWENLDVIESPDVYAAVMAERESGTCCNETSPQISGYACSRGALHRGRHIATGAGLVCAAWPGKHAPSLADLGDPAPTRHVVLPDGRPVLPVGRITVPAKLGEIDLEETVPGLLRLRVVDEAWAQLTPGQVDDLIYALQLLREVMP